MKLPAGPDPNYLAFDTSGPRGSVAVRPASGDVTAVILGERGDHAARLVPAIDEALRLAGVGVDELAGIVVGEGPGSFTGVRVAAATAKALSGVLGVSLWPVSSLAGAAVATGVPGPSYVLFDARGDRVYGACYALGEASLETLNPPHGGELRDVLDGDLPRECLFTGDGSLKHRGAIESAGFEVLAASGVCLAEGLLRCIMLQPEVQTVEDVGAWEPRYVRTSSAERLWTT